MARFSYERYKAWSTTVGAMHCNMKRYDGKRIFAGHIEGTRLRVCRAWCEVDDE